MSLISHTVESIACTPRGTQAEIACDHCGKHFFKKAKSVRADLRRGRQHFYCCRACCVADASGNGANPPTSHVCQECGTPFQARAVENRKFCSQACSGTHTNRVFKPQQFRAYPERFQLRTYMQFENDVVAAPAQAPKRSRMPHVLLDLTCEGCGKPVVRAASEIRKTKHGKPYCSKSCRMRHYNHHVLKPSGYQRSGAEDEMIVLIQRDFPALKIVPNDRQTLSSGLEIDIHLPEAKLAIELNGPVHYRPIYGEERFAKVQAKDVLKHAEIQAKGLALLVLDVSRLKSKKRQHEFIAKHYEEDVKPLLAEIGSRGGS